MWLTLALLLSLSLSLGHCVESGCADWKLDISRSNFVCCQRCKPGNRLLTQCGLDPKTLCVPCVNETYTTKALPSKCLRCTQCISPLKVKTQCTASSDTVCECAQGFLCGDSACSYCVKECGKGEEPAEKRECRPCPKGTFNDQIHSQCTNWSSTCPLPNQKIVAAGTAISNVVCADLKSTTAPPDVKPPAIYPDSEDSRLALVVSIIILCLLSFSSLLLCFVIRLKKEKTIKKAPILVETPAGRSQIPEPEQCSSCFPQEEHGSGSQSSLLCDDKPFELVV